MEIKQLIGKTLTEVIVSEDKTEILFVCDDGEKFLMYHEQDCCEGVSIEDITGDIEDLIGSPILKAEENSSNEKPNDIVREWEPDSETWTFYNIATIKGHVTIRWFGSSNGYYSESVSFVKQ